MSNQHLEKYNSQPEDAAGLILAAQSSIDSGMHDAAMLFIEEGLRNVSDPAQGIKLLEQASISGFYSKLPRRQEMGRMACERIATDMSVPWGTRNTARQNSTYYSRSAADLMPSTRLCQVGFIPPYGYSPMNPSISADSTGLCMIQRTVNYVIRHDGSYDMKGDVAIRTINHFIRLRDDLSVDSSSEILMPTNMPEPAYELVQGFEDSRLFFINDEPWCTSTVRELSPDGMCEIVVARLVRDGDNMRLADHRVIIPDWCERQHQKNWMPMVSGDDLFFVYSTDPTRIVDQNGSLISLKPAPMAMDSFRGGSPLMLFGDSWLGIIHESHVMPDNRRRYMHRFVCYDFSGSVSAISDPFYFKEIGIEFAAGMASNPTTGDIVISFGFKDRESWLASINPDDIKKVLRSCGSPLS